MFIAVVTYLRRSKLREGWGLSLPLYCGAKGLAAAVEEQGRGQQEGGIRGDSSRSRGVRGGGSRSRGTWSHCCKDSQEAKEMDTELRSLSPFYSVWTQAHEVYELPLRNGQRFDSQAIFRSCLVIVNIKSPKYFGLMYTPTWLPGYPEDKGERKVFWSFSLLGNHIVQIPHCLFCSSGKKFPGRIV